MRWALSAWDLSVCGTDSIREDLEGPGGLLREGLVEWGGPLRRAHLGVSLGRPLVVASGSKAYRRAGSPGPSLLPLSAPLSLSFLPPPMLMTSSWASFTSAKDELRLTPLRKPSPSRPRSSDHAFPQRPFLAAVTQFAHPVSTLLSGMCGDDDGDWRLFAEGLLPASTVPTAPGL